jgi:hypothetical protein
MLFQLLVENTVVVKKLIFSFLFSNISDISERVQKIKGILFPLSIKQNNFNYLIPPYRKKINHNAKLQLG